MLLPTNTPASAPLFYAGWCECCGPKYLANKDALQCGSKATHKTRGYGHKQLTLNRRVSDKGDVTPLAVQEGDTVIFGKYAGTEVKIDGEDRLILREDDILGIVEG